MQKSGNGNLAYQRVQRFGSLHKACDLIGHKWTSQSRYWQARMRKRLIREDVVDKIGRMVSIQGVAVTISSYGRFWVADQPCHFEVCWCKRGGGTWLNHCKYNPRNMVYLIGRMNKDSKTIADYYVIPRAAILTTPVLLHMKNRADVDRCRAMTIEAVARQIVG